MTQENPEKIKNSKGAVLIMFKEHRERRQMVPTTPTQNIPKKQKALSNIRTTDHTQHVIQHNPRKKKKGAYLKIDLEI